MRITVFADAADYFRNAFFSVADNDFSGEVLSASSTEIRLRNYDTGLVTTFTGTGLPTDPENQPLSGTVTTISTVDPFGDPIMTFSDLSWGFEALVNALKDMLVRGDDRPIESLLNMQPIIVDAGAATVGLRGIILDTTTSNVTFIGSDHNDRLSTGHNNDSLDGGLGNDTLIAGLGNDTLRGGDGSDHLMGDEGDDLINPGDNTDFDFVMTGLGDDVVVMSDVVTGYVLIDHWDIFGHIVADIDGVNNTGTIMKDYGGTTVLTDVVNPMLAGALNGGLGLSGSNDDDRLTISVVADGWAQVRGQAGNDTIEAAAGSQGALRLDYSAGTSGITANLATGVVSNDGFGDSDALIGHFSELRGTDHDDSIIGSDHDDRFITRRGMDTVDGGDGWDVLRYDRSGVESVNVDLSTGMANVVWSGNIYLDRLSNIEEVRGSRSGNDTLIGDDLDNVLQGRGGDDSLSGGLGNDRLYGEDGNDTLNGGDGYDQLFGGAGNDYIDASVSSAGAGSSGDFIQAGLGEDTIIGNAAQFAINGLDISYLDLTGIGGISIVVGANGTGTALSGTAGLVNDSFTYADFFIGTPEDDIFSGSDNETYEGWEGNAGDDLMDGGGGFDELFYTSDHFYGGIGAVTVNFAMGMAIDGFGDSDSFVNMESVRGTAQSDHFTGDMDAAYLSYRGLDGADTIIGSSSWDRADYFRDAKYGGTAGIVANLAAGTVIDGFGQTDTVSDIDHIRGTDADDEMKGSATAEYFESESGNDTLLGGAGDDTLSDGRGDDRLEGGDGDDLIIMGSGTDYFDGGAGRDTLRLDLSHEAPGAYTIAINLLTGHITNTFDAALNDRFFNIEDIDMSGPIDTTIIGNGANSHFVTGGGNDTLTGGLGDDTIEAGDGSDTVIIDDDFRTGTGALNVTVAMSGAFLRLGSDMGTDMISEDVEFLQFNDGTFTFAEVQGASSTPVINGTGTNVDGTEATEIINGTENNNWITPGGGSDTIDGGAGNDMASFFDLADTPGRTNVQYRLDIDLTAGTAVNHDGSEQLEITNVERITGTVFADRIKGDAGDNELRGLGDYDWFIATEGNDTIDGGTGQDMLSFLVYQSTATNVVADIFSSNGLPPTGTQASGLVVDLANPGNNTGLAAGLDLTSIERITGSGRQDVFFGDSGQNDFRGLGDYDWFVSSEGGRERYFGGDGIDTVTYYNASAGVIANLSNGATVNGRETGYGSGGVAARDLYFEIENLVGSRFNDELRGSSGRNQLNGLEGDDFIFGYGGVDYLMGGLGDDTIDGGGGSDYALFSGDRADYTLTRAGNEVTAVGSDGTDRLIDVEYFRFDDGDVAIWSL